MLRVLTTTTAMLIALPLMAQTADTATDAPAADAAVSAESQALSPETAPETDASDGAPMGMDATSADPALDAPVAAPLTDDLTAPGSAPVVPEEVAPADPVAPAPELTPAEPVVPEAAPITDPDPLTDPALSAEQGVDAMGTPPIDAGSPAIPSTPAETLTADPVTTQADPLAQTPADTLTADPAITQTDPLAAPAQTETVSPEPAMPPVDPAAPMTDADALADALSDETAAAAGAAPTDPAADPLATPTPSTPATTAAPTDTATNPAAPVTDEGALADALAGETATTPDATTPAPVDPAAPTATPAPTDPTAPTAAPATDAGTAAAQPVTDTGAAPAQPVAEPDPTNTEALSEDASGEVTETVISDELARSSSEDFDNDVDEGLSDDAKNILFGLGGFAIGHVLADRSTVEVNTGDRIIVREPDGDARVIKNDDAMLVMPGYEVRTEDFDDGSSRSIITRPDGSQVITIRDAQLRVLSRRVVHPDGTSVVIVDQTVTVPPVDVRALPAPAARVPVVARDEDELRRALTVAVPVDRIFSLNQVLTIREVRELAVPVGVTDITFATGSAAITPDQARSLLALGNVIRDMIARNPSELFLIEGHTDSVGDELMNLALSDRRAESLAKALTEHFKVPAENLVVQGYGERYLLVPQEGDIRENRRAAVRRITPLISGN